MDVRQGEQTFRGAGGIKSLPVSGARTGVGLTHRFFFLRPELLNNFLEIKEFKARAADFLNPFNRRAAVHCVMGPFISQATAGPLGQSKKRREIRGGGG